jgi:hypothetical protein
MAPASPDVAGRVSAPPCLIWDLFALHHERPATGSAVRTSPGFQSRLGPLPWTSTSTGSPHLYAAGGHHAKDRARTPAAHSFMPQERDRSLLCATATNRPGEVTGISLEARPDTPGDHAAWYRARVPLHLTSRVNEPTALLVHLGADATCACHRQPSVHGPTTIRWADQWFPRVRAQPTSKKVGGAGRVRFGKPTRQLLGLAKGRWHVRPREYPLRRCRRRSRGYPAAGRHCLTCRGACARRGTARVSKPASLPHGRRRAGTE